MSHENKVRPGWLRSSPLVSAVMPETPLVQKYRGAQGAEVDAGFAAALSDAALDGLARAGVNLIWIHFYNGFGMEFEKAELERARATIGIAHAKGMKAAETVQLEESECHNWLQLNSDGQQPVLAGDAFFRARPCFNSESYLRYMERVCSTAADFGADLVHFENAAYNAEPDTCHCSICVASFREFLRQRYGAQDDKTRQAGMARFGHNVFTHVRPPVFSRNAGDLDAQAAQSPHVQEWTAFKAHSVSACLSRLARGVGKRNPECAVSADLLRGFSPGQDAGLGVRFEEQLPLLDVVTSELSQEFCSSDEGLKVARLFGVAAPVNGRCVTVEPDMIYPVFDLAV